MLSLESLLIKLFSGSCKGYEHMPVSPVDSDSDTAQLNAVHDKVDAYLAEGWIRPSSSTFGHPISIVRKKGGKLQMAVDF